MIDLLRDIEEDPAFAEFDYDNQVYVRMKVLQERLQKDKDYLKLNPQQKAYVIQELATQPPKFKNKQLEQGVNDLLRRVKSGDKRAITELNQIFMEDARNTNSVIASLVDEKLIKPLLNKVHPIDQAKKLRPHHILGQPEEQKAIQALLIGISEDAKLAKTLNTSRKIMGTFTNIAEIVGMGMLTAGTWAWPQGAAKAIASMGGGLTKAAAKPAVMAAMRTGQVLTHGAIEGISGVVRENLKDVLNKEYEKSPEFREIVRRSGTHFKDYFLWDVLFNFAFGVALPTLRGSLTPFLPQTKTKFNLNDENFNEIISKAAHGEDLPEKVLQQLRPDQQMFLEKVRAVGRTHRTLGGKPSYEDVLDMIGAREGYGMMPRSDGAYDVYHVLTEGKPIATVKDYPEFEKFLVKQADELPSMKDVSSAEYFAGEKRLTSREILRATVKGDLDPQAMSNIIAPVEGKFNPQSIRNFGRLLLKDAGVDDDVLKSFKVKKTKAGYNVYLKNNRVAFFKERVMSPSDELRPIRKLTEAIDHYRGTAARPERMQELLESLKSYEQNLAKSYTQTPAWANYVLKDKLNLQLGKSQEGYKVIDAQGTLQKQFNDFADLRTWIIKRTMNPEELKYYLHRHEGLYLSRTKDGSFRIEKKRRGTDLGYKNSLYAEAKTFDDLVEQNPELFEKLPSDLGPKFTVVNDGQVRLEYVRGSATGTQKTLLNHLDGFYEAPINKNKVFLNADATGSIALQKSGGRKSLEVYVDALGDRKYFSNYKEAIAWFKKSSHGFDELQTVAAKKGYILDRAAGKYLLYGEGGYKKVMTSVDEVKDELAKVKLPSWAPELTFEMKSDLYGTMPKPEDGIFRPDRVYPDPEIDADDIKKIVTVDRFIRPKDAFFEKIFKQTGDDWFANSFMDIETTLRALDALSHQHLRLVEAIWSPGGKMIKLKHRKQIFYWMQAKYQGNVDEAKKIFQENNFGQRELSIEKQTRKFYDELSEVFDINYDDLIFNYLPRIREAKRAGKLKVYADGEISSFLDDTHAPHELKAFFDNQRVSEVLDSSFIDDPLELMTRYASVGYRQRLLGPVWKRLDAEMKQKIAQGADTEVIKAWGNYRDAVMGMKTSTEKTMIENLNRVLKSFGVDKEVSKTAVEYFMSLGYFAAMGLRPWIVFRNTMQPWTTLAPRVGNQWVAAAMKKFNPVIRQQIENLRVSGFIKPTQMPVGGIGQMGSGSFDKLLRKMLTFYKNSDDYTRAVAYGAYRLRWQDSMKKFAGFDPETGKNVAKTIKTQDEFIQASGMDLFSRPVQKRAIGLVSEGKWDAAGDFLAKQLSDETMFMYRAAGRPDAFKGHIGKIFGMFGTYPVHYLENIRRGFSHGSFANKALYASTFLFNTTLLWQSFKNLGVNAQNFLFFQPAFFTGGPMYHMFNQALLSTKPHYEGRQARAKLFGLTQKDGKLHFNPLNAELFKWAVPGSFLGESIIKGIEAYNNGDVYKAFLNFTSAPVDLDWFQAGPNELGNFAAQILYDLPVSAQIGTPNLPKVDMMKSLVSE